MGQGRCWSRCPRLPVWAQRLRAQGRRGTREPGQGRGLGGGEDGGPVSRHRGLGGRESLPPSRRPAPSTQRMLSNWVPGKHLAWRALPKAPGPVRMWGQTFSWTLWAGEGQEGPPPPPCRQCGTGGDGRGGRAVQGAGQMQAQHRVEQPSLAGAPASPAFLLTLGSSRTKDRARAQW